MENSVQSLILISKNFVYKFYNKMIPIKDTKVRSFVSAFDSKRQCKNAWSLPFDRLDK